MNPVIPGRGWFVVKIPFKLMDVQDKKSYNRQIYEWCVELFGPEYEPEKEGKWWYNSPNYLSFFWRFRNKEDAAVFALTWC